MTKLTDLLNKLIEKWWKPFWKNAKYWISNKAHYTKRWMKDNEMYLRSKSWYAYFFFTINDLCSIDSWLWQFVCKNNFYRQHNDDRYFQEIHTRLWYDWWPMRNEFDYTDYEYRLMLSSIQEDKEKFLLDNILIPKNKDVTFWAKI